MRALRLLHRHLPDLPAARRRTRRPRGRIYLIKQVLEGRSVTSATQQHPRPLPDLPQLRESTCPSACSTGTWSRSAARWWKSVVERPPASAPCAGCPGGPDLAAVRACDEARPAAAPAAAGDAAATKVPAGALPQAHRRPTREHRAQGADADGLRAAGDDAQHQQRHRARARRRRHPDPGGRRGRLLRRHPHAPERHRGRPGHAPQRRRLVAAGQRRQGRGDRDECLGLRRG